MNSCLAYSEDPRAAASDLPLRRVVAVVVSNPRGQVLLVRRSQQVDEFKGAWSFPSSFLPPDLAEEHILHRAADFLSHWLALPVTGLRLIWSRLGLRPAWRLRMFLATAETQVEPSILVPKYDACRWVDGRAYFLPLDYEKMGDCSKAYVDYLKTVQ